MHIKRRTLLTYSPLLMLNPYNVLQVAAQETAGPPLPNKATFQSGDLVWPKKPGAFVPYRSVTTATVQSEEQKWIAERNAFIQRLRQNRRHFTPKDIDELRTISFREFYARYVGDQKPGLPGTYSSGGAVYVGHVGIIEIDGSQTPWVIEALGDRGVVRTQYDEWIKLRPGEIVWHGRVRELDAAKRSQISAEAKKYIGQPYDFWNFDLNDASGFYCSKLVWLCIWRTLNIPIDGNSNPKRTFWLSPKQLLYLPTIARLHDPGAYATR